MAALQGSLQAAPANTVAAVAAPEPDPNVAPEQTSDDEVVSAERPQTKRKRPRADGDTLSAGALEPPEAAPEDSIADQPARKLAKAIHPPRPASAQSCKEGQLPPSEHDDGVPAEAQPVPQEPESAGPAATGNLDVQEKSAVLGIKTPAERVAPKQAAAPNLADKLNPNNAAYDPGLAAHHRAMRAQTDPQYVHNKARRQISKLTKRMHLPQKSAFTAEEHGYLLDLQGELWRTVKLYS